MKEIKTLSSSKEILYKPKLSLGDSVYYKHPKHGVAHGRVAAIGEHGFITDTDDGEEHKTLWEDFLGHRQRANRKLTIVDRGEDGSIMEDETGKRVYVRGELPDFEKAMTIQSPVSPISAFGDNSIHKSVNVDHSIALVDVLRSVQILTEQLVHIVSLLVQSEKMTSSQSPAPDVTV